MAPRHRRRRWAGGGCCPLSVATRWSQPRSAYTFGALRPGRPRCRGPGGMACSRSCGCRCRGRTGCRTALCRSSTGRRPGPNVALLGRPIMPAPRACRRRPTVHTRPRHRAAVAHRFRTGHRIPTASARLKRHWAGRRAPIGTRRRHGLHPIAIHDSFLSTRLSWTPHELGPHLRGAGCILARADARVAYRQFSDNCPGPLAGIDVSRRTIEKVNSHDVLRSHSRWPLRR